MATLPKVHWSDKDLLLALDIYNNNSSNYNGWAICCKHTNLFKFVNISYLSQTTDEDNKRFFWYSFPSDVLDLTFTDIVEECINENKQLYNKYQEYQPGTLVALFDSDPILQIRHGKLVEELQQYNLPMYRMCGRNYENKQLDNNKNN